MTDLYPSEEGYIDDGQIVGFCKANASITLHGAVTLGATGVSGYISVGPAGVETGVGIALKAADTNDYIPVAFRGIVKQTVGTATFSVGRALASSGTTAGVVELIQVGDTFGAEGLEYQNINPGATTFKYRLGYSLQAGTTAGDEALIAINALT